MIDVILPALDEALALPLVIPALPPDYRPIVVDNGSTDGTAEVARELGAVVVHEPIAGYGAAVHAGLLRAEADVVCVMDADASLNPKELPNLVSLVETGVADLAIGRRRTTEAGSWPWHARLGNRLIARRLSRTVGVDLHDIGPVRVTRREPLLALGIEDRRFGYPIETIIRAAAAGWTIIEVDVSYGPRAPGTSSKVTGSFTGTAKAVVDFYRVLS